LSGFLFCFVINIINNNIIIIIFFFFFFFFFFGLFFLFFFFFVLPFLLFSGKGECERLLDERRRAKQNCCSVAKQKNSSVFSVEWVENGSESAFRL
jgi:hypothetical protein